MPLMISGGGVTPWPGVYPLPAELATFGYNTTTKFDHFETPGTVDINNTKASGFNLYPEIIFGGSTYANPAPPWTVTPPSAIDVSNSILTIQTDLSGYAGSLYGACDNNVPFASRPGPPYPGDADGPFYSVDPNAFKGWAFKNGAYVDFAIRFDPVPFESPISPWISVWSEPTKFLFGGDQQGVSPSNRIYTEMDFFEAMLWVAPQPGGTMALNSWINPRPAGGSSSATANSNDRVSIPGVDWTQWNVLGTFWCPMSDNGGTGFIHRYFNGILLPAATITWTAGGLFSNLDTQVNVFTLGPGVNHPVQIDWFRVTQKSFADLIVQ